MASNLYSSAKVTKVIDAAAAGTGTTTSSVLDMSGFGAVTFYVAIGAITAGGSVTVKAQQAAVNGSPETFADLAGTSIAWTDSDDSKIAILEIDQPAERYVRVVVTRSTQNAVIDLGLAFQHEAYSEPVTQSSSILSSEYHLQPAEGTA